MFDFDLQHHNRSYWNCLEMYYIHTHTYTHTLMPHFGFLEKKLPLLQPRMRLADELTPASRSPPIKTHRSKHTPPLWPHQQTCLPVHSSGQTCTGLLSCPSCCSTQPSFKSIYELCDSPLYLGAAARWQRCSIVPLSTVLNVRLSLNLLLYARLYIWWRVCSLSLLS